jgi:hypothetical protein
MKGGRQKRRREREQGKEKECQQEKNLTKS